MTLHSMVSPDRRLKVIGLVTLSVIVALLSIAPAAFAADSPSAYPPPPPESAVLGDVTGDMNVNIVDAMFIAQYTVQMRTFDDTAMRAGDTSGDGQLNVVDAMQIAQFTVDPTGDGGILFKPLWEWKPVTGLSDEGLWDPLGQNAG